MFFSADDGAKGRELWSVPLTGVSQRTGYGCGARFRQPKLAAGDPILGRSWAIWGTDAPVSTSGFVFVGPRAGPYQIGTCWLYLDPSQAIPLAGFQTKSGSWRVDVPLADTPALVGVRAMLQTYFVAGGNARGFELSNGVSIKLGR